MSVESAMRAGRAAAERNMVDACVIERPTGSMTDIQTAVVTETMTLIYDGKCRIQQHGRMSRPATVAEAYVFQSPYELQLPVSTSLGIQIGDRVTMTVATTDPDLLGRKYWTRELADKTHATSRRLGIEEVGG